MRLLRNALFTGLFDRLNPLFVAAPFAIMTADPNMTAAGNGERNVQDCANASSRGLSRKDERDGIDLYAV